MNYWRISLRNGLTSRGRWNGIPLVELGTFDWNYIHLWARYLLESFQYWLSYYGSFPWVIKSIYYWNTEKSISIILKSLTLSRYEFSVACWTSTMLHLAAARILLLIILQWARTNYKGFFHQKKANFFNRSVFSVLVLANNKDRELILLVTLYCFGLVL